MPEQEILAEYDQIGEATVADRLARNELQGVYRDVAVKWLAHKAQARSEASSREQSQIARSAKNAAWAAAIAAIIAAICAIISLFSGG